MQTIIFHLEKPPTQKDGAITLNLNLNKGFDTAEEATQYWMKQLCNPIPPDEDNPDLTKYLKVDHAWFVVGHPPSNQPRLEADITSLLYHPETCQLEIGFALTQEDSKKSLRPKKHITEVTEGQPGSESGPSLPGCCGHSGSPKEPNRKIKRMKRDGT